MSIVLRYVDISKNQVKKRRILLGFLKVDDSIGKGISNELIDTIKVFELEVNDIKGSRYDNASNMKEKYQAIQNRQLEINPRAFYTSCCCHSLNLMLCDMAKSCPISFFGVIQYIFHYFLLQWSDVKFYKIINPI